MQQQYLELLLRTKALKFGSFKTKAGRISPYFLDSGLICNGLAVSELGRIYAKAYLEVFASNKDAILFGPAYKGIGLVFATAMALYQQHNITARFCYNRKELKDHGEGGQIVGHPLQPGDKIVIVEDVLSRGTSVAESVSILAPYRVDLVGLLVGVDRQEKGFGSKLARDEILEKYPNMQIHCVTTIKEIVNMLESPQFCSKNLLNDTQKKEIKSYLDSYSSTQSD